MKKAILFCIIGLCFVGLAFAGTVGKVTGTGAEITVKLGFKPSHVVVTNVDNGASLEWFAGMPNGWAIKHKPIIANADTADKSIANIVSGGISMYNGTKNSKGAWTNQPGFKFGADADVNVSGKDIYYKAE